LNDTQIQIRKDDHENKEKGEEMQGDGRRHLNPKMGKRKRRGKQKKNNTKIRANGEDGRAKESKSLNVGEGDELLSKGKGFWKGYELKA